MKVKKSMLFLTILLIVVLVGCASIVSKSTYPVTITSEPSGAEILIKDNNGNTIFTGQTPSMVDLNAGAGFFKGATYNVTFKMDGFNDYTAQINRGVDGWYVAGNFFIGGIIGWLIVDPATGAMWTLKDLHADLNTQSTSGLEKEFHFATIDEVPADLRLKMVRIN